MRARLQACVTALSKRPDVMFMSARTLDWPMHLAAGVTDKLIGIHTWSDPCKVGPYRAGATVWKGREFFPALDPASSRAGKDVPDAQDAATIARRVRELLEN